MLIMWWIIPVARFSKVPESFRTTKAAGIKISNLMITELFYLIHILHMTRSSLHSRSFRRIHLSVFRYRLIKNSFAGPKSFRSFRETGPRVEKNDHGRCSLVLGSRITCLFGSGPLKIMSILSLILWRQLKFRLAKFKYISCQHFLTRCCWWYCSK